MDPWFEDWTKSSARSGSPVWRQFLQVVYLEKTCSPPTLHPAEPEVSHPSSNPLGIGVVHHGSKTRWFAGIPPASHQMESSDESEGPFPRLHVAPHPPAILQPSPTDHALEEAESEKRSTNPMVALVAAELVEMPPVSAHIHGFPQAPEPPREPCGLSVLAWLAGNWKMPSGSSPLDGS